MSIHDITLYQAPLQNPNLVVKGFLLYLLPFYFHSLPFSPATFCLISHETPIPTRFCRQLTIHWSSIVVVTLSFQWMNLQSSSRLCHSSTITAMHPSTFFLLSSFCRKYFKIIKVDGYCFAYLIFIITAFRRMRKKTTAPAYFPISSSCSLHLEVMND